MQELRKAAGFSLIDTRTMIAISAILALVCVAFLPLRGARAASDDLALFSSATAAPPNIMLLLDTSGSMKNEPAGCDSCTDDKWEMARDVVLDLVDVINPVGPDGDRIEKARFGVFFFDSDEYGGRLVIPIEDGNTNALLARVAAALASTTP